MNKSMRVLDATSVLTSVQSRSVAGKCHAWIAKFIQPCDLTSSQGKEKEPVSAVHPRCRPSAGVVHQNLFTASLAETLGACFVHSAGGRAPA